MATATQQEVRPEELSAVELQAQPGRADGTPELPFAHRAYVCNITEREYAPVDFDYGRFKVSACPAGKPYHLELITARFSVMDHGEKHKTQEKIGALHIAHDLVRMLNGDAGDQSFLGLFVVEYGKVPTPKELAEANEKLDAFCRHYVQVANEEYENHRKPILIPGFARWAAKRVKVDVPFLLDAANMIECPACTTKMPSRAAICPNCKFVVNARRARELGLIETPAAEPAKPEKKAPSR